MAMDRDDIIWNEITKIIHESAASKARNGFVLKSENINAALAAFVAKYDLYLAFWNVGERALPLVIRRSLKKDANLVGNAVFVQDRATALQLHAVCRASDNIAPEPPGQ
jgi:hypothetical protein